MSFLKLSVKNIRLILPLKAIYLGSKMNSFFKESFSNKAKEKNIDVYEVDMDINNYKLIRKLPA